MFENKKKIIIFFSVLFLVAFLLISGWFYIFKYYKNFSEVKIIKEDVCRSLPSYIKLSPVADYITPKKKFQPWKPLDNIYSLKEQYAFCLLFQLDGSKAGLTNLLSDNNNNNEQFFKEYETLSTVNKIFKARDCSTNVLGYITTLKELIPKLSDIDENKICTLLLTGDFSVENTTTKDDLEYLDALRNNDKKRCQKIKDMYISIACQVNFIEDNSQFCDAIYNEIKKEACD